jgi:hypothetical protein
MSSYHLLFLLLFYFIFKGYTHKIELFFSYLSCYVYTFVHSSSIKWSRRHRMVVWIYTYLCNQCLSPLTLWVRTPLRRGVLYITLCDQVCHWLAAGRWFSLVSSINKTDLHDINEMLLKVALNKPINIDFFLFLFVIFGAERSMIPRYLRFTRLRNCSAT